jgi:hypothetical protein
MKFVKRKNSATPRVFPTKIFVEKTMFRNLLGMMQLVSCQRVPVLEYLYSSALFCVLPGRTNLKI